MKATDKQWHLIEINERSYMLCHPSGWVHSVLSQAEGDRRGFKNRAQTIVNALNEIRDLGGNPIYRDV